MSRKGLEKRRDTHELRGTHGRTLLLSHLVVFASYSSATSMQGAHHVPRPGPGIEDTRQMRDRLCPGVATISRGKRLRNRPLNYSEIVYQLSQTLGINDTKSLLCGTAMPGCRDRADRPHHTSKSDKRMKKTGQCDRLTMPDKAPSQNNQNVGLGANCLGSNSDSASS